MTYQDQWRLLSSRIRGLVAAGELQARYYAINRQDTFKTDQRLLEYGERFLESVRSFRDAYGSELPPNAVDTIEQFCSDVAPLLTSGAGSKENRQWSAFVQLAAFESEMSHVLGDTQEIIRSRAERAFVHLQHQIAADQEYRRKWKKVFKDKGEPACEGLGAVHLLLHGIFAFKVDAKGGCTDLVFHNPIEDPREVGRYVDGIVLTEWKKAKSESEADDRLSEARRQADIYRSGVLAGIELAAYRYLVIITEKNVRLRDDEVDDGITYRHMNIAVDPRRPSEESKKKQR